MNKRDSNCREGGASAEDADAVANVSNEVHNFLSSFRSHLLRQESRMMLPIKRALIGSAFLRRDDLTWQLSIVPCNG